MSIGSLSFSYYLNWKLHIPSLANYEVQHWELSHPVFVPPSCFLCIGVLSIPIQIVLLDRMESKAFHLINSFPVTYCLERAWRFPYKAVITDLVFFRYPNTWTHGDYIIINSRTGGITMLGRSDGTLNPSGVRFGSAEIYSIGKHSLTIYFLFKHSRLFMRIYRLKPVKLWKLTHQGTISLSGSPFYSQDFGQDSNPYT